MVCIWDFCPEKAHNEDIVFSYFTHFITALQIYLLKISESSHNIRNSSLSGSVGGKMVIRFKYIMPCCKEKTG